jgi:enolase-phosphatase E1
LTVDLPRSAIGAIVLDIEGTTTPIAFVYEVLFPFARRHLRDFLAERSTGDDVRDAIGRLRQDWSCDVARGETPPPWTDDEPDDLARLADYVEWLMDRDRKSPGLKLLQGFIWERGYRSGALKSDVFADVLPALQLWGASGIKTAIYSSGSVLAQQLLFAHTPSGDITRYFADFFDTSIGAKTSSSSYGRIAAALGCHSNRLLFISDSVKELDAARQAGCLVLLCVRPGNAAQAAPAGLDAINGLDEVRLG